MRKKWTLDALYCGILYSEPSNILNTMNTTHSQTLLNTVSPDHGGAEPYSPQGGLFGGALPSTVYNGAQEQMRLRRIQTYNWGTFDGLHDFNVSAKGYLFVGPSGSGKSTTLDAHATLLTPPVHVKLNAAAREGGKDVRDRSLFTYVRGAWAKQTAEGGEVALQYLRPGTTWSAISETYQNALGRSVTLIQLFWIKGKTNNKQDVKRHFLIAQTPFDISDLEFFAESDFDVRKLKQVLPDLYITAEFSAYQNKFLDLLGIEKPLALRLLHKTQSAKNLGDLNEFMRDFMLDRPETFDIADRLVLEFGELKQAYKAVVDARLQIETLAPAEKEYQEREQVLKEKAVLDKLEAVSQLYREQLRLALIRQRIQEEAVELEAQTQNLELCEQVLAREQSKYDDLRMQRKEQGGGALEQLQRELAQAEAEKEPALHKRSIASNACDTMGWAFPDTVVRFVALAESAKAHLLSVGQTRKALDDQRRTVEQERHEASQAFTRLNREIRSLEDQRSNLPYRLLQLRQEMAEDLGITLDKIPFVGELLQVRASESEWQGAIERVLGGFSRSLLVDDKYARSVMAYVNGRNLGADLTVQKVRPQLAGNRTPTPLSLVRKLEIAKGPFNAWLSEELKAGFDYECVDSVLALDGVTRGVTREGQVKRNTTRHEKRDRKSVNDRTEWVLGFDNKEKLEVFKEQAFAQAEVVTKCDEQIAKLNKDGDSQLEKSLACRDLSNITWREVDVTSILSRVQDLQSRIAKEGESRPDLIQLDHAINTQKRVVDAALAKQNDAAVAKKTADRELRVHEQKEINTLERWPNVEESLPQAGELSLRYARHDTVLLDTIDEISAEVRSTLVRDSGAKEKEASRLEHSIQSRFEAFMRNFKVESANLDATLQSAPEYFLKLEKLRDDGLPAFQGRFETLMRDQSDQNIALLSTKLSQERSAIRARMELVNESLATAPFNPGTHLTIETSDRTLEEVRAFKLALFNGLSHISDMTAEELEVKYLAFDALVDRLGSQETVDRNWRALVLDVREHVEFIARELDEYDNEVEVYSSAEGKSGGQKQKLATTCLAAALRYQLGGVDRALPIFSTVVIDEAFDKADSDFTKMVMNIFKSFGFQMVVATPMKGVMTLEPFIGGASYVHIKDRKKSAVVTIDYDEDHNRLKLSKEQRAEALVAQAD